MDQTTLAASSAGAETSVLDAARESPDRTELPQREHECESHQAIEPPTTVREWQDAQPVMMLDRYKVAPIGLPD